MAKITLPTTIAIVPSLKFITSASADPVYKVDIATAIPVVTTAILIGLFRLSCGTGLSG